LKSQYENDEELTEVVENEVVMNEKIVEKIVEDC
jgi:hypothetical protein